MAASWKTLRIFISSTFRDMQAERDHLVRFVFPKLREELLKRRIHLIDVDLRWGVTSDQNAVSICREVIDECHPRFMGMLGGRYGWIPDGHERSITADEVYYGVLEREAEMRWNAFFYFRNEEATASIVEEAVGDFREPEGSVNARKLADLKQSIVNAGLPAFVYGATWDVQQRRLTGLEPFGDHVYGYLLQSIQNDPELADRFTSSATASSDEFAEEREAMEAFIEDRTERYVVGSRQLLFDEMIAFTAANGEPNVFVIEGELGSGKSSLLGKLCQLLVQKSIRFIPHFVGASAGSTDLRRTLRRLCYELAAVAEHSDPIPEGIRELIDLFCKLLGDAGAQRHVILVLDALNQFDATDGAHNMHWLPQELPPNVRIVISSLKHPALEAFRRRGDRVRIEKLKSLSENDACTIIEAFLQRYSKRFSAEQIAALLAKSESHLPLYLLTALQELRTLGTYEEIIDRIRELPGEAKALFGWILEERLSNDPGFRDLEDRPCGATLVAKFASYLGVSRHGLSQEELIGLIDPGDPLGHVAALLRLLRPYLMRRGELLDFFHGQLRAAVNEEYLQFADKRLEAHQILSTYFHGVADPNREGRWKGTSTHALGELPYHQIRSESWLELVVTLESLFFVEGKVAYGMAFELAMDFCDAVAHMPLDIPQWQNLKLLEEALRRDIHFIASHAQDYKQALFQCLWNSGWWYDCPEAAFHYEMSEGGWKKTPPWNSNNTDLKLSTLLQRWRTQREAAYPGFFWLRSLRPPSVPLGGGLLAVFRRHEGGVTSVAFSPDSQRVLSGSSDKTCRLWDAETGRELAILRGHEAKVRCVAFSPDGQHILSGSEDSTLREWDTESGRELAVITGHKFKVKSVAYSPDGRCAVIGLDDNTVRVWDAESGRELAVLHGHHGEINGVAFSPDGKCVLSGSGDSTLRLWETESGREISVFRGHHKGVTSVAFSPDGRRVLSGSIDQTCRLWEAETGQELAVLHGHESWVTCVAFSPDGRSVCSGSSNVTTHRYFDTSLRLWNAESGQEITVLHGHEDSINCVSFSLDGRRLLSGADDKTVRLWDAGCLRESRILPRHEARVGSLAFSPDGKRALSGSDDMTLRLWDTESGHQLFVLRGHNYEVNCVAFSPEGRRALSGDDQSIILWDIENGKKLLSWSGYEVSSVAFSPDGKRAIANGRSNDVWDTNTGQCLSGTPGYRQAVADSYSGSTLWHGSLDNGETLICSCASENPKAWFTQALYSLETQLSGRIWAGASGGQIFLLRLEGRNIHTDESFQP